MDKKENTNDINNSSYCFIKFIKNIDKIKKTIYFIRNDVLRFFLPLLLNVSLRYQRFVKGD